MVEREVVLGGRGLFPVGWQSIAELLSFPDCYLVVAVVVVLRSSSVEMYGSAPLPSLFFRLLAGAVPAILVPTFFSRPSNKVLGYL